MNAMSKMSVQKTPSAKTVKEVIGATVLTVLEENFVTISMSVAVQTSVTRTLNAQIMKEVTPVDAMPDTSELAICVFLVNVLIQIVPKTRNAFRPPPSTVSVKMVSSSILLLFVSTSTSVKCRLPPSAILQLNVSILLAAINVKKKSQLLLLLFGKVLILKSQLCSGMKTCSK